MRTLTLLLLLFAVLGFLFPAVQSRIRAIIHLRPPLVFGAPLFLSVLFGILAAAVGAFSAGLTALILAYCLAPTLVAFCQRPMLVKRPSWPDLVIILMLWLPLEFGAGEHLVPKPAQSFLHSVAYAVAILLALVIFTGFRVLPGMKYSLPRGRDLTYGVAGFLITAPVLIAVGRWLDFIPAIHAPVHPSAGRIGATFAAIFVGTALPEEILFRSLIQNWCIQRYGAGIRMLLLAGFIFGCAHLDNGSQPLPNWRYMILATIAGVAYGWVFQKSSSVFSSVTFHALVDATKHVFF